MVNGALAENPVARLRLMNVRLARRAGGSVPSGGRTVRAGVIGGDEAADSTGGVGGELGGAFSLSID